MRSHLRQRLLRLRPAGLAARLPRRTVRLRLTVLYGALFLASGTGLLAIVNILARGWPADWFQLVQLPSHGARPAFPAAARNPVVSPPIYVQVMKLVIPRLTHQDVAAVNHLLAESAIALAVMAIASVVLGWLMAGRVLRPLRDMTTAARAISEDNLYQRLAVPGPGDELKDLGDTIDNLLDRLQAAFDAQRNFVASASHELRTPLTVERAMLEVALADPAAGAPALRSVCEELLETGRQQERLIDALLTLARSQRGLDHRDPLDLAGITREVLDACEPKTAARGLVVTASITPTPMLGDARLLEALAANLIDNAIHHNIPGGQITIQVTASSGHPTLKITNTGPVIPPGQITRLLQPFQRLPATRSAGGDGLGLGLPIVAAIAKAHHATLTLTPARHGGLDAEISFTTPAASPAARDRALATT